MVRISYSRLGSLVSAVTTCGMLIECLRNVEDKEISMMSERYSINLSGITLGLSKSEMVV